MAWGSSAARKMGSDLGAHRCPLAAMGGIDEGGDPGWSWEIREKLVRAEPGGGQGSGG